MTEALFQIARFQLLIAAITPGPAEQFDDAYVYAWDAGVYPVFHEWARLHRPFAEQFIISPKMMHRLMNFLDDRWGKGSTPTFHELEESFSGRKPSEWDRSKLISALRYTFLAARFDKTFFDALRGAENRAFDITGITCPFDRAMDITVQ